VHTAVPSCPVHRKWPAGWWFRGSSLALLAPQPPCPRHPDPTTGRRPPDRRRNRPETAGSRAAKPPQGTLDPAGGGRTMAPPGGRPPIATAQRPRPARWMVVSRLRRGAPSHLKHRGFRGLSLVLLAPQRPWVSRLVAGAPRTSTTVRALPGAGGDCAGAHWVPERHDHDTTGTDAGARGRAERRPRADRPRRTADPARALAADPVARVASGGMGTTPAWRPPST
jgi:hypothetical protein